MPISTRPLCRLKERLEEVESRLPEIKENVTTYSESNVKNDQYLVEARQKLNELLEKYTEANPKVLIQRNLVKKLEEEFVARGGVDETPSKVVTGLNPEYLQLKRDKNKFAGEIASSQTELKDLTERLVELRARRELLNRLGPDLRTLEDQLRQKKSLLAQEEVVIKELELFLERSFSDISIQEPARAPNGALPRKLFLFSVIGLLLGIVIATLIVMIRELFNLTTRSETDLTKALHLRPLASFRSYKFRAGAPAAVTHVISRRKSRKPALVVIALIPPRHQPGLFNDLYESITIRKDDWNMSSSKAFQRTKNRRAAYLVNDYLYQLSEECLKPDKSRTLYFKRTTWHLFRRPASSIDKLLHALNCEVIFWELFDFELHRQLLWK